eukprot:3819424-Prymnesium_polylepis.1
MCAYQKLNLESPPFAALHAWACATRPRPHSGGCACDAAVSASAPRRSFGAPACQQPMRPRSRRPTPSTRLLLPTVPRL